MLRGGRESAMSGQIPVGEIHHLRLTVTDVQRSREFYTGLLGFQIAVESPPPDDPAAAETFTVLFGGVVMIRGNLIMGLRPMAPATDRFDPDRVGLDHLSFGVPAARTWSRRSGCSMSTACPTARSVACPPSASTCSRSRTRTACSSSSPLRSHRRPGSRPHPPKGRLMLAGPRGVDRREARPSVKPALGRSRPSTAGRFCTRSIGAATSARRVRWCAGAGQQPS